MFRGGGGGSRLISNNKPFGLVQPSKTSQYPWFGRCLNNEQKLLTFPPAQEQNLFSFSPLPKAKQKKSAFTLVEAMLAVVVIGVISAIIIPILYNNVMGDVKEKRISTFYNKLSKATDNMLVSSGMQGYSDTMDFVNTLKKYMKIDKVCDKDHIAECWGTKKVVLDDDGKEWEIKNTTTPRELKISKDKRGDSGYKDVVAIITADQVPMIISYNKACELNQNDRTWATNGKSASLDCISGVFDWNGGRNPNKLGNDVITLGESAGLGSACAFIVNGNCYLAPQTITQPLLGKECENKKSELGLQYCVSEDSVYGPYVTSVTYGDRYAKAAEMCGSKNNMISREDLNQIAFDIYGTNVLKVDSANHAIDSLSGTFNATKAAKYGISLNQYIWTSSEYNTLNSYARFFFSNRSGVGDTGDMRIGTVPTVICSGE